MSMQESAFRHCLPDQADDDATDHDRHREANEAESKSNEVGHLLLLPSSRVYDFTATHAD